MAPVDLLYHSGFPAGGGGAPTVGKTCTTRVAAGDPGAGVLVVQPVVDHSLSPSPEWEPECSSECSEVGVAVAALLLKWA
jgi:hypothetical protein